MPVIVRELDDDAATIIMVDSNIQRENILPSERAFAYQMKLEALKHQGLRNDLTSCQLGTKLKSERMNLLAEQTGMSSKSSPAFHSFDEPNSRPIGYGRQQENRL